MAPGVSSYDNPAVGSGTVLNAVQFAYNGFGQLITEYQSTGGSVNTSTTPRVEYDYASGADNTIRPWLSGDGGVPLRIDPVDLSWTSTP